MAYATGLNQRVRNQLLSNNISTQDQSISQTNLSLMANLKYVQQYIDYLLQVDLLPDNNPNFTGNLTSTTGGNISISSTVAVPTITSNTNFTGSITVQSQPVSAVIVGEIRMTLSDTLPPHFLLCNGQSVSKTVYPDLFNVIGYNYGGSGANFNLPNLQSRYPIGANGFQNIPVSNFATGNGEPGANNTYSSIGGNTLPTWSEVPIHSHNINDPQHAHANSNYSPSKASFEGDPGTLIFDAVEYTGHDPIDTSTNITNLTVSATGTNLAPVPNDTVSSLKGVNVSLSYVAVSYCIAY